MAVLNIQITGASLQDVRAAESVAVFDPEAQRLDQLQQIFASRGANWESARHQAIVAIASLAANLV